MTAFRHRILIKRIGWGVRRRWRGSTAGFAEKSILSGSHFGRPWADLTARLPYVDLDGARVLMAAEPIPAAESLHEAFLRTYCGASLEGIDLICDWFNA